MRENNTCQRDETTSNNCTINTISRFSGVGVNNFDLFSFTGDVCDEDDDNDSIFDALDNCPLVANKNQNDTDGNMEFFSGIYPEREEVYYLKSLTKFFFTVFKRDST